MSLNNRNHEKLEDLSIFGLLAVFLCCVVVVLFGGVLLVMSYV